MSASRLREAAAQLRGLAGAATPGPWAVEMEEVVCKGDGHVDGCECPPVSSLVVGPTEYVADISGEENRPDAELMAAMDPVVAVLVADLLDSVARAADMAGVAAEHPEALSIRGKADVLAEKILEGRS